MVRARSTSSIGSKSGSHDHYHDSKSLANPSQRGSSATRWSGTDRQALFSAIEKYGIGNWTAIAACVPGKTAKQCRDQWMKKLSPQLFNACGGA